MTRKTVSKLIPLVYLLVVVICLIQSFDYRGQVHLGWTLAVFGLTLPLSVVSVWFSWLLLHGAGLEFFTSLYLLCAGINALSNLSRV
jgi:hypothetical protein